MGEYILFQNSKKVPYDGNLDIAIVDLKHRLFLKSEKKTFSKFLKRLYFRFLTAKKTNIFLVLDNGIVVHESFVCQKCWKFPFLGKHDCEIGPCYTNEKYRGRGIYPTVLKYIMCVTNFDNYFMVINENNAASINGVKKAGFCSIKKIKKTRFLKVYKG